MNHSSPIALLVDRYIGLVSDTSPDDADGVLTDFSGEHPAVPANAYVPFSPELRQHFLDLQHVNHDEICRKALATNALAMVYVKHAARLFASIDLTAYDVQVIGVHGQTVRCQPDTHDGIDCTCQTQHPAVLAEHTDIGAIADFRS